MGGQLKSEDEETAYAQAERAKQGEALCRVTAMFSATMPSAVERIAKTYLRHPAIVKIGDSEGVKNKRIDQRVLMTTEGQKKSLLMEIIRSSKPDDKIIVFVNAKKGCDVLGRHLEAANVKLQILHGKDWTYDHFISVWEKHAVQHMK